MTIRLLKIILLTFIPLILLSQPVPDKPFNCFSILAGKKATMDESVMLAHNEDDYGEQIVNWIVVPAAKHNSGEVIRARNGAAIPQVTETARYIWFDMPGMEFSDSYLNEYGVTIASNACPSREDSARLTDGGLTWELRQLMAQRAHSARHAVKIAVDLLNQYGYASSGRTYCIADPEEAWMLSVVNGKHYVALRIPDDAVAVIPNYYTITSVNTTDTNNCIASADLISYAVQRGWYNPPTDGKFSFRKAYGSPRSLNHPVNIKRMWSAINALAANYYELDADFPWLIMPTRKVSVEWLSNILSSHYEGTPLDLTEGYTKGHPHGEDAGAICASHTQYGFVAQLRNWMPADVGAVLWMIPRHPCIQAMIPVYCGIQNFPSDFSMYDYKEALKNHFNKPEDIKNSTRGHVYWQFSRIADSADSNYLLRVRQLGTEALKFNREQFNNQESFELGILSDWKKNKREATRRLNNITEQAVRRWLGLTQKILENPPPQW
ncbi:MAG: hypothetical protein CVU06_11395 [Bacteroidetes bacterium HGW-Bacteroidetes-22]|nr:MAG: hypothetical protein CVU06_11395 [Bacteroidetes bacterium HGW-Bacteroidetes-22]